MDRPRLIYVSVGARVFRIRYGPFHDWTQMSRDRLRDSRSWKWKAIRTVDRR